MAATPLTVTAVSKAGAAIATANSNTTDGNTFANDGRTFLYLSNPGASTAVVTVATGASVGGFAVADQTITLLTTVEKIAGPFDPALFNDANGLVTITFSDAGAADVDVMAFR